MFIDYIAYNIPIAKEASQTGQRGLLIQLHLQLLHFHASVACLCSCEQCNYCGNSLVKRFAKGLNNDDHMLRFARSNEGDRDGHMLRFARLPDAHLLRFARSPEHASHLLRFARAQGDAHMLRFAKRGGGVEHLLRFAKDTDGDNEDGNQMVHFAKGGDDHLLRFTRSWDGYNNAKRDHLLRFARSANDDHMLRFARANEGKILQLKVV